MEQLSLTLLNYSAFFMVLTLISAFIALCSLNIAINTDSEFSSSYKVFGLSLIFFFTELSNNDYIY